MDCTVHFSGRENACRQQLCEMNRVRERRCAKLHNQPWAWAWAWASSVSVAAIVQTKSANSSQPRKISANSYHTSVLRRLRGCLQRAFRSPRQLARGPDQGSRATITGSDQGPGSDAGRGAIWHPRRARSSGHGRPAANGLPLSDDGSLGRHASPRTPDCQDKTADGNTQFGRTRKTSPGSRNVRRLRPW